MNDGVASPELCARCKTIDLSEYLLSEASPGNIELGHFQDILKNKNCLLCKVVVQTLSFRADKHWESGKYPREMCHLGRYRDNTGAPGQPRLQAWFHSTTETLPEGVSGHFTTLGEIQLLEVAPHHSRAAKSYKPVARMVGERVSLSVLKTWMEDCTNHPKCSAPTSGLSTIENTLPLLLIDVTRMRLVECDWSSRYVALSYVWGRVKQFQTIRSNFKGLLEDGSLVQIRAELPKVINDAIDFVTALGESYLWIDTLCIVQDDMDSKDQYVSRMDMVYGQALLTIVALSGHDANASLPGVSSGSRKPLHLPVQVGPFKLLAGLPGLSHVQQSATWSRRGWTFQEGILCKRRVYFWDHQMYWQCASSYCAESTIGETRDSRINQGSPSPLERNTDDSRSQYFVYQALGKMYCQRQLTFPSDSLKAFSGILSAVERKYGWQFASALPDKVFDLALLWRPYGGSSLKLEQPNRYLSTWCWTSWTGFIHWDAWRLDSYAGKDVSVDSRVVDYFVKDKTGLRRLVREQSCGQSGTDSDATSLQLTDLVERISIDQSLPPNTLVFEADSLSINGYTLSQPLPESSWALTRPASYQFKNVVRGQTWIYNEAGCHCGTMAGLRSWRPAAKMSYDFVLLSRSDQDEVTQADIDNYRDRLPLEYYSAEEYYKEVFDTNHFEYKRWWAFNILLIQWKGEVAERVGIGLMHADAWDWNSQQRRRVVLR